MTLLNDYELLKKVADIYSQQAIADKIDHPREVVNRWLKERAKQQDQSWFTYPERIELESMLPSKPENDDHDFTFIDLFAGIGGIC